MESNEDELRDLTGEATHKLKSGTRNYRSFVGGAAYYDVTGAMQFNLMTSIGLREHHKLLDIGCGSLCGGRLFIPWLQPGNYFGVEPNEWLIEDAIRHELGAEFISLKKPRFANDDNFTLTAFGENFDYIVAQSILTHTSRAQLDRCLEQASQVLRPDGIFAANFCSKGKVYEGADWAYPEMISLPRAYVAKRAEQYGLVAHPLFWANEYDLYWMLIVRADCSAKLNWLGNLDTGRSALRILELENRLSRAKADVRKWKNRARAEQDE